MHAESAEPSTPPESALRRTLGCRNALLLQGPAGPFFRRLAAELRAGGATVLKVNFHAGDRLFFPGKEAISYRGSRARWPSFVAALIEERGIDAIFLFGDCRAYHRAAIQIARARDVAVWVFEEGYLRPDFITLEKGGVNGYSSIEPRPERYLEAPSASLPEPEPRSPGPWFGRAAWYSALNALAYTLLGRDFPEYEHHRDLNAFKHALWYVRSGWRKLRFEAAERGLLEEIIARYDGAYYFVPLQVHSDFQLGHSEYEDVTEFIEEIVATFAAQADPRLALVFKHHPMDRPFREYGPLFERLRHLHGLEGRLYYVHDLHLPTLLRHARGTITINSTVGLSSIHHHTPVKVMGRAIYDMPGLTHQGSLEAFLSDPGEVDDALYRAFRRWLLAENQANGNFYRRLGDAQNATGIDWFPGRRQRGE
ncbi:MAG: capsular biosynthesis protein [Myxococcales bacterium]|nr:capsular biosynthesis protein [Myxococcales bacterium]